MRGAVLALGLIVLLVVGGVIATGGAAAGGLSPLGAPPAVPAAGAGSGEVLLSADATAHPSGEVVRAQLQRHFDGINGKDYALWLSSVVPARAAALPEERWLAAYASTGDGTIRVDRIDTAPDGALLARVRFISTQNPADAPPDLRVPRLCWRSTLPMRGTPPLIDLTGGGSSAKDAC